MQNNLIIIFLTLLLSSCGSVNNEQLSLPQDEIILAFGDSLTFGKGVQKINSYPRVLAKLTNNKVINAGISGETTLAGRKRFKLVLQKYQPSIVILLEGGNDILRGLNLKDTKANLAKMIEIALNQDIKVLLIGVPKKALFLRTANFYQELADKYPIMFAKDLLTDLLKEKKYKSDLIHLNKLGYKIMATQIYTILLENLD